MPQVWAARGVIARATRGLSPLWVQADIDENRPENAMCSRAGVSIRRADFRLLWRLGVVGTGCLAGARARARFTDNDSLGITHPYRVTVSAWVWGPARVCSGRSGVITTRAARGANQPAGNPSILAMAAPAGIVEGDPPGWPLFGFVALPYFLNFL